MTKVYFRKLSKELSDNLDATIQKSINEMVEEDQRVVNDPKMQTVIVKGAVEAYHNRGIGVYYDALALCNKISNIRNSPLNVNVNIWQGGKDTVWTSVTSNYLRNRYSNATYSFINDEGHLLYLSQWDEIIRKSVMN